MKHPSNHAYDFPLDGGTMRNLTVSQGSLSKDKSKIFGSTQSLTAKGRRTE